MDLLENEPFELQDAEEKVSAEFYEALSKAVQDLCDKAVESAKGNGRKTLQAKDV